MRVFFSAPAIPAFAILLACSPALAQTVVQPAAQADADVQCAATFLMLESNARASGISNGNFAAMVVTIQQAHIASHPAEDVDRYNASVNNAAQSLQQALATGVLGFSAVQSQVMACNARYRPG